MAVEEGGDEEAQPPHREHGRHWPEPGDPPEGSGAAGWEWYASVGALIDSLRKFAREYYSSDLSYMHGYQDGMRKSAMMIVDWLRGKGR